MMKLKTASQYGPVDAKMFTVLKELNPSAKYDERPEVLQRDAYIC